VGEGAGAGKGMKYSRNSFINNSPTDVNRICVANNCLQQACQNGGTRATSVILAAHENLRNKL
jgi:hypothetical protein